MKPMTNDEITRVETMLFKHRGDLSAIEAEYGVPGWQVMQWVNASPQLQEAWSIATKAAEIMNPAKCCKP